jgi:uncharacterized repeat protein (TIGR01451 family)
MDGQSGGDGSSHESSFRGYDGSNGGSGGCGSGSGSGSSSSESRHVSQHLHPQDGGKSGSITFTLYSAKGCSGSVLDTEAVDNVTADGNYTTPTGVKITAAGTYYWVASFSGDSQNNPVSSGCNDEPVSVGPNPPGPNTPSIATSLSESTGLTGDSVTDSASLSGESGNAGGTVTYSVYSDSNCHTKIADGGTVTVTGGSVPNSKPVQFNQAGTYYWQASYSGDANNAAAISNCSDEQLLINTPAAPGVQIVKTADNAEVNVGEAIGFTLTVYNTGEANAHGVKLSDLLPTNPGLSWSIDSQGSGWAGSCAINAGVLTCGGANGVIVPAGTTQAGSAFTVHVTSPTAAAAGGDCPGGSGVVDNTGQVTTSEGSGRSASASTCVEAQVDLAITKTGSPNPDRLPGNITWTMVVTNHGPDADTSVTIVDPMPAGNTFVSAAASKGTCTGGAILTCNIGDMAVGESVTITLVTTPSVAGTVTNTVIAVGGRPETNTANNTASASVVVEGPATPPVAFCVAISKVKPTQLFVGRKTTLTIGVTKHGKAVKGVRVRIKGPKLDIRTKPSNQRGVIKKQIKLEKPGVLVFSPIASRRCNTKRIGITGVFTPPVTG